MVDTWSLAHASTPDTGAGLSKNDRLRWRNLFFYWTGPEFKLIRELRELFYLHSNDGRSYRPHFVCDANLGQYVPALPARFPDLLPAHKADYLRVYLLNKFGGIWVDSDTLVMTDLASLFSVFEEHDGFFITQGTDVICNGVFGSRPATQLMTFWLQSIEDILGRSQEIRWAALGNRILSVTAREQPQLFERYTLFSGPNTMYPVNWDAAREVYCAEHSDVSVVKRDFQPLIVLVNSVYRAVESRTELLEKSLLSELLRLSRSKVQSSEPAVAASSEEFARIYADNFWGSQESKSGIGSSLHVTRHLRRELPLLLRKYGVSSILDIPCGDFNWMREVDLEGISYLGADLVDEIVRDNINRYPGKRFATLDITSSPLPRVDLIFCRDCLFHLSYADIRKAITNCARSGSTYLMVTSNVWRSTVNGDIRTGAWRKLNLENPPFDFPQPLDLIVEGCQEGGGFAADKCMCLWRLSDIGADWSGSSEPG